MKRSTAWLIATLAIALPVAVIAGNFKLYPGAVLDSKATDEARKLAEMVRQKSPALGVQAGEPSIYTTTDPFEKVLAFYQGIAKEYDMPGSKERKLPSGQALRQAFFIFDGAPDLASSKLWAKIQRPYVGDLEFKDIRDVTAIVVSERK
jgi:hypothetical protein